MHAAPADLPSQTSGIIYTNIRNNRVPWSIHVIQIPRNNPAIELRSVHAKGNAVGLSRLSEQAASLKSATINPVGAVNGDFYQREGAHAGDPRGLQIVRGELISAPIGGVSFWIDALGQPHTGDVTSELSVTWPDGTTSPIGLNGNRDPEGVELYTPSMGPRTKTEKGRELVLELEGRTTLLPLRPGRSFTAKVSSVRDVGNTEIPQYGMVISVGPLMAKRIPRVTTGAQLTVSTATSPNLRGAKSAISGGPVLVSNGKPQRFRKGDSDSYEYASMSQRHPRSAIGWNEHSFFLVQVDGRKQTLSIGMTLSELASFLAELGCSDAMNLDGGGSATLWYNNRVRNEPCDGEERAIANALVVVEKKENAPEN